MISAKSSSKSTAISRLPGLLRKASSRPAQEVVHKLRTTIRRAETVLHGTETSDHERLAKQLKRIRKRVGELRDIDVQLALLEDLNRLHDKDALAVGSALQAKREKQERRVRKLVGQELEDGLLKRLEKVSANATAIQSSPQVELKSIADEFSDSVRRQILTEENLHEFRTVTKKLKYRAELASESAERDELVAALKQVQDAIGHWHDGLMLSQTAEDVLGDAKQNSLLSLLRGQNHSRFLEALRAVERGRASIKTMFAEPPRKKPTQSEIPVREREAAGA